MPDHGEEVLEWHPLVLTRDKIESLWDKISSLPEMFCSPLPRERVAFIEELFKPTNLIYEIGDEIGLASALAVRPRLDASVHLVMFDRRLRGREPLFMDILKDAFRRADLVRATAAIPEGNAMARRLLEAIGFSLEGRMRSAAMINGHYEDIEVYGLLREELFGG